MTSTALMTRASIYEREAARNRSIELFAQAYDAVEAAITHAASAAGTGVYDLPALKFNNHFPERDRDRFMGQVRRAVDKGVWSGVLHACGLSTIMDKTEHERFRAALAEDPPEATVENLEATVIRLIEDRETIFRRGIANAFSRLDRRFRSHDGFKVGSRMVLSGMFGVDGFWNHYRRHDETLVDVERAFCLLDRKPQPERHAGIYGVVQQAKAASGSRCGPSRFEAEDEYFRVRVFANGNAHLWFKRSDLVEKVNQLLADYYGANLGAGPDVAAKHHAPEPGRAVAKNLGFFESPAAVVSAVMDAAGIYAGQQRQWRILEPSAGTGSLSRPAAAAGHAVTCVELHTDRAASLSASGQFSRVICADFLALPPGELGQFDRIVMNPPFDKALDVDHVSHALRFLAPGGRLVAVMSAGAEFREDRRHQVFRAEVIDRLGGRFRDLPPGSFAEAGTMVNTCILTVEAPR